MKIKDCGEGDCRNSWTIAQLMIALKPFADYADALERCPPDLKITAGSPMAKAQLTMGHCYEAKRMLEKLQDD